MPKWKSLKYPNGCLICGTTEKTHIGRGLCSTCYQREMKADDMETLENVPKDQFSVISDDANADVLDLRPVGQDSQGEDVGDTAYTAERAPGFGASAPPRGPAVEEPKPKGLRGLFAKKAKQSAPTDELPPTREKKPKVMKGKRVSSAETLGDIWSGVGALAIRSGRHVPLGRYMQFSSGVSGEILDDAVKGTAIDRLVLQPVAKGRGRFDALGAVFGPPAIILAIEKDPSKADVLIPVLKSSIRNALPLMAPAIKRLQKKEEEIKAAAEELGFSGEGDPADEIIAMIFGDWIPPAPPMEQEEEEADTYAAQAS